MTIPNEKRQLAVDLYSIEKEKIADIAKRIGASKSSVRGILYKSGIVKPRPTPSTARRLSVENEDKIIELYQSGLNIHDAADEFGCVTSTVLLVLRRRGVPRRPMVKRKKLSFEQRRELSEKYTDGATFEMLYKEYDISNTIVESCLDEFGIKARTGWGRFKTEEWEDRLGCKRVFKSRWELAYAKWMDAQGYDWEYEPKKFSLKKCSCYTPDFRVRIDGGVEYREVKGWLDDRTVNRIKEFLVMYPSTKLRIIGPSDLARMGLVEEWYVNHKMSEKVETFQQEISR